MHGGNFYKKQRHQGKKQFAIETIENPPFAGRRRYRELQI